VLRDFAQNKGNGSIDIEIARYALKALNVDAFGLDEMDNKNFEYLLINLKILLVCLPGNRSFRK
jgi:Holliday junction DNA helicase RuvB